MGVPLSVVSSAVDAMVTNDLEPSPADLARLVAGDKIMHMMGYGDVKTRFVQHICAAVFSCFFSGSDVSEGLRKDDSQNVYRISMNIIFDLESSLRI